MKLHQLLLLVRKKMINLKTKIYRYFIYSLCALYIVFCSEVMASDANKIGPPYPDVWGYDLVDNPMIPVEYKLLIPYFAPNGDIVFEFRGKCIKNCDDLEPSKQQFSSLMFWFFSKKVDFVNDLENYENMHKLELLYGSRRVSFSDGTSIKTIYKHRGSLCQINALLETAIIRSPLNELDNTMTRDINSPQYTIIGARQNINRNIDKEDGLCDRGGPGGGEIQYLQLYNHTNFVSLKDGSFLVYNQDLIVRLDKDFKTKFEPQHDIELTYGKKIKGNFFVLPYKVIEELNQKVMKNNDHGTQGLHDELLLYLYRKQQKTK